MYELATGVHDQLTHGAYAARAVLDECVCDSLTQANLTFLERIAARHREQPESPAYGLAASIAAGVAALDLRGRVAAAGCPYTLFNMGFDDGEFWRGIAVGGRGSGSGSGGGGLGEEAPFARTAVFLAWHLAHSGEFAAALVLGMTPAVQQAWQALPLSAIERAALAGCARLEARWARHHRFWPRLLGAAARASPDELGGVRLLGLQLLAAGGIAAAAAAPRA